jgi:Na+/proline symporter
MSGWALLEEWAIPVCGSVLATELVSRVIAARSPTVARRSSFVGAGMYLAVGSIPLVVGLTGAAIVGAPSNPEGIVPAVALQLLSPFLFAIFAGGLVAAILSTVDSTLLVASGLLSHNLLVPVFGITADKTKLRLARGGVAAFGVVAYVLALRAEGVFALVEQASAFGGAPALVTICFALFSTIGGPRAALASLIGGVASYLAASYGGFAYPFLLSLAVSLTAYLIGAATERRTLAPHAR